MTYQYSNFGVPGLGLKRGLGENRVIAPYATGLAAMVDPVRGCRATMRLWPPWAREGRYGFYEAMDFTASRLPADADVAIVRSFMAHHQGMTITAIANTLQDGLLRRRFHAEPLIQAVELLLQERVPRDVNVASPARRRGADQPASETAAMPTVRRFDAPEARAADGAPAVERALRRDADADRRRLQPVGRHRRSPAGGRMPPATRIGTFIFARDARSGALWSAGMPARWRPPPATIPRCSANIRHA